MNPTPRAREHARAIARRLLKQTPAPLASEIATIADTSFQLEHGYVLATANRGPIHVVGAPLASLVPGMRVFVAKQPTGSYLYLGPSAQAPTIGTSSGALVTTGAGGASSFATLGSVGATDPLLTLSAAAPTGLYQSFFLYLPQVPLSTAVLTDLSLVASGAVTAGVQIIIDRGAHLGVQTYGSWPGGTLAPVVSAQPLAPHRVWFLTVQFGNGLALNGGAFADYHVPMNHSAPAGTYGYTLLSDHNGASQAPAGTWISKIQLGVSASAGQALWPLPVADNPTSLADVVIPQQDSDLPMTTGSLNMGLVVLDQYLCSPGAVLADSVGALPLTLFGQLLGSGPY